MKKVTSTEEYLAGVQDEQRTALEKLRKTIQAAAPKAEEYITYGIPAFRLNGALVGFGAAKTHCAFYPMSASVVAAMKEELKDYDTSKGTIRFKPDHPLPVALIRKIVKSRIAENAERNLKPAKRTPK